MNYSHPASPQHVIRTYRKFVLGEKRVHGRAHMKYRAYINEYLAAKQILAGGLQLDLPL